MGMGSLREGAWIDAHAGQRTLRDGHAKWVQCPINLASIGLPDGVRALA
jgi:hypothetical protein